jgi:hypothetical protein
LLCKVFLTASDGGFHLHPNFFGKIAASLSGTFGGAIKIGRDQFPNLAIKSSGLIKANATRGSVLPLNALHVR